jgi:hypothetical protein
MQTTRMNDSIKLKPMKESHLKELGVLAAKAFHDDPGFSWIFYEESTRHEYNAWLWERILWISLQHKENYVLVDSSCDKIVGMVCPVYPDDKPDTLWTEIKAGILKFPFVVPRKSFSRAMLSSKASKEMKVDIAEVCIILYILF